MIQLEDIALFDTVRKACKLDPSKVEIINQAIVAGLQEQINELNSRRVAAEVALTITATHALKKLPPIQKATVLQALSNSWSILGSKFAKECAAEAEKLKLE